MWDEEVPQKLPQDVHGRLHEDSSAQVGAHYRPDLDGLRAIAVLAVVVYHINCSWLPGGFFGVDIFFVISGFVVSGSLARRRFEFTSEFLADFYARRCRRLLPSFILVCFTTAFAIALLSPWFDPEIARMLRLGIAGTLGNANHWLWYQQDAYFDQRPGLDEANAFLHLWSLGVEEQFYCLFPVMFLAGYGQRVVSTVSWKPSKFWLALIIMALSVTSLGIALKQERQGLIINTFYLMPMRFWQLGAGSLVWQICDGTAGTYIQAALENNILSATLEISSAVLMVCSFIIPGANSADSFNRVHHSILPVSAAIGYILSGLSSRAIFNASLSRSLPVLVGRMSYTIYLWHVPVLAVYRRRFGETVELAPTCLVVTALLSCTSFYLFEEPARKSEFASNAEVIGATVVAGFANVSSIQLMLWLRAFYGASSGIWLVALGAGTIFLLLLIRCLPRPSRWRDMRVPSTRLCAAIIAGVIVVHFGSIVLDPSYVEFHPFPLLSGDGGAKSNRALQLLAKEQASPAKSGKAGCDNTAEMGRFSYDLSKGLSDNCDCNLAHSTAPFVPERAVCDAHVPNPQACYEDRPVDPTTFAVQYENMDECYHGAGFAGLEAQVSKCFTRKDQGKSALFLVGDSHARALQNGIAAAISREILPAMWYGGSTWTGDILGPLWPALEAELVEGDAIWYIINMQDDKVAKPDLYQTQVRKLHELTRKKKGALVLVEDWPSLQNPGPGGAGRREAFFCHSHHTLGTATPCAVTLSEVEQKRAGLISILKEMQTKEGVYVFNTTMFLCPDGVCDYNIPNRRASAYFDANHLNPFGSRYLAPFICDFAKSHGLK